MTCCKLDIPQHNAPGSCVITSAGKRSQTRIHRSCKPEPTAVAPGSLCIRVQSLGSEVKPLAARLRTGRSYVASSRPQSLPRLQPTPAHQHRTLSLASDPQVVAAEQPGNCRDLTLFGVGGGAQHIDEAGGLEQQQRPRQPRKSRGRLEAARAWAARHKSTPTTEPHR